MNSIPESRKNHLWRKVVWHTDPDEHPLGPFHSIEVYCCEEANGYSVWYIRRLAKDDLRGAREVENGDYLLNYFSKNNRDAAIERAVLISNGDASVEKIVQDLDSLAAKGQKV